MLVQRGAKGNFTLNMVLRFRSMFLKPKCKGCGACCISIEEQSCFVDVTAFDVKRLDISSRYVEALSVWDTAMQSIREGQDYWSDSVVGALKTKQMKVLRGPFKGVVVCACIFLKGSPMHDAHCSKYSTRPKACREALQPDDKECLQQRAWFEDAVVQAELQKGDK